MNVIRNKDIPDHTVIFNVWKHAKSDVWDGRTPTAYFNESRWHWHKHNVVVMLTRDVGHHSGGWWKNPDFERCVHLSLSFVDQFGNRKPHNAKRANQMVQMIFGSNAKMLWCEPPYSEQGIQNGVWHYRLFCDAGWNPIKPRGEVYSTEFTDAGWKSFSEISKF